MKQNITPQQYYELSTKSKKKYKKIFNKQEIIQTNKEWYGWIQIGNSFFTDDKNKLPVPLITIGKMMEFLQENTNIEMNILNKKFMQSKTMEVDHFIVGGVYIAYKDDLCDALWEGVKEILKRT